MSINKKPIPQRIYNASSNHPYVAGAVDIIDDVKGKSQQQVNADVDADLQILHDAYEALTQTPASIIPVSDWPVSDPEEKVIYRVPGDSSYSDYMWDGNDFILMATYDNAIDDNPTPDSDNLVKSGGVAKYKAYMANNGYGMDNTLTIPDSEHEFFLPESIEFHEGDKLIVELNSIEISAEEGGALAFVPWKSDGTTADEYVMRYNYGDDTPMIAVWTILSDISIKGLHISKNSEVTAYTAKVRFAGNYAANIYECVNGVNANQENISVLQSANSNNRNGLDVVATLGIESASETNPHFTFSKPVNFKQGDKILFEVTSADIVGSSGAAIVPILENADGVLTDYQVRVNIGAGTPIVIVWTVLQDIAVTGVTIIKNSSVTSYTASFRMAGNNGANIYLNAKAMADLLEYENVVIATRNVADYNSIRELVASLPATPTNKYLVYVPKGRWFECDLNGRKYVKIVGEDRDETVLYCDGTSSNVTPEDYSFGTYAEMPLSSVNRSYKHCIRVMDDIDIENLTVEVNDAKYCIHVDASGQRKGHFGHLKLIADANVNFPVGMGVHANQEFEFDGCEILQYTGTGGLSYTVYVHNMNNQSAICKTVFRNCYFNKNFADFGEMGSEYSALIDFINCYSSRLNPVFHFGVESVDGHSYWVNPATGHTVTDLTLVPYSIKLNYIGTNAYGFVQNNRPDILNYVIGENRIIR